MFKLLNIWPPFLGAGIRVKEISRDLTSVTVQMKLHFWNRNIVGAHYGGSLFSMTDPFYALMLAEKLGRDYLVVDKAADIHFKKLGKGKLTAKFNLSKERIAEIKNEADTQPKSEPKFTVQIMDEAGEVVAEVYKTVYVRRKDREPRPPQK